MVEGDARLLCKGADISIRKRLGKKSETGA